MSFAMGVVSIQPRDVRVSAIEQPIYPFFDPIIEERHMKMLGRHFPFRSRISMYHVNSFRTGYKTQRRLNPWERTGLDERKS